MKHTYESGHAYETFLSLLCGCVENANPSGDTVRYETQVRQLLGNNAYELYTMDKLIVHLYKQIKIMGDDDVQHRFAQIFRRYRRNSGVFRSCAIKNEASHWSSDEVFGIELHRQDGGMVVEFEYIESLNDDDELVWEEGENVPVAMEVEVEEEVVREEVVEEVGSGGSGRGKKKGGPAAKKQRRG